MNIFNKYVIHRWYPRAFIRFLTKDKPLRGAEIGVWRGENAKQILDILNIDKLFLIDPYKIYDEYTQGDLDGSSKLDKYAMADAYKDAINRVKKHKYKVEWLLTDSKTAKKYVYFEKLDFVYIDGNHAYQYVYDDIDNFFDIVKDGGMIAGHDADCYDVIKAVIHFMEDHKINKNKLKIIERDWMIFK